MTLEQIGNLAEAVGAIAVVISLIYLAIQLRQNTQSVRSATYQAIVGAAAQANIALFQDRALARILRVGSEDPMQLDEDERAQFSFICTQFFDLFENLYLQYEHGSLDDDYWLPRRGAYLDLFRTPGFAHCWAQRKEDYSRSFGGFVDAELSRPSESNAAERLFLRS